MIKSWIKQLGPSVLLFLTLGTGYWYYAENSIPFSAIEVISAPYAHENNLTGKGSIIAVIDGGFDKNHSLLQKNFSHLRFNGDFNTYDVSEAAVFKDGRLSFTTHGTHVSGIIAGADRKIGVAPEATLIPIKMGLMGGDQAIVKALDTASRTPANIVNISMQLSSSRRFINPNVKEALFRLAESGKIIVIAAGNSGIPMGYSGYTRELMQIARDTRVQGRMVVVGATTYKNLSEGLASFSNFPSQSFGLYGISYFITAPGDEITSTVFGGKVDKMSGTSMATPMVSGSLALLKQNFPHLAPEELVLLLLKSARRHKLGTEIPLNSSHYGHGVVNVEAALKLGQKISL